MPTTERKKAAKKKREPKIKTFLTEPEIEAFLQAAKKTRNGKRDHCLMLMVFRHGLRVSEAIDIRLSELDLSGCYINVRRLKGSRSGLQPIEGDEVRAIRSWMRDRVAFKMAGSDLLFLSEQGKFTRQTVNYLVKTIAKKAGFDFPVNPHMLRHTTGFILANKNTATRTIQELLGHKNIGNTERYTAGNPERMRGVWRK